MKVLIVGGVAGGASCAARLRRLDEKAEIVIFEKGQYISFANCGLPYYIGGTIEDREALLLQSPESMKARFNIDVRVENQVLSIDKENKKIQVFDLKNQKQYEESYDVLVLSPGSTPLRPPIKGIESQNVVSLWNMADVDHIKRLVETKKPKKVSVIGGGFIGLEMAENLHDLGAEVSLVEMADQVMAPIDKEMAHIVHQNLLSQKVNLHLSDGVDHFEDNGNITEVHLSSGKVISSDLVILSIGIRPQSQLAQEAGLKINQRGGIVVDETLITSDPNIYAIGDAIEVTEFVMKDKTMIPLAGPANKQGRIVADRISGKDTTYRGSQGTSVAKVFDLTVASTGLNEKQLKQKGLVYGKDYMTLIIHPASHAGYYPGAMGMSIKLIFGMDGKVLGAQNVGYDGVEKRIDVIATAIRFGATVEDLEHLELAYAPPYSSAKDPVNMAGFTAGNILSGLMPVIQVHELKEIDKEKSIILDVRTKEEVELGMIPGAIHMDINTMREHLEQLDKSKTIVVYCAVGIRGHAATQILLQNGFEKVLNLVGGYKTFAVIECMENPAADQFNCVGTPESLHRQSEIREEEMMPGKQAITSDRIKINACGLQCPGPIMKVYNAVKEMNDGEVLEIMVSDPGFESDIRVWCDKTGNQLLSIDKGDKKWTAFIKKGNQSLNKNQLSNDNMMSVTKNGFTSVVFSGDLDKAIASLIIANGAAAMGKEVTLFFTFWGLNILRRPEKVKVKKDIVGTMFGKMMPRGTKKLGLSKMNMGGMGAKMIRQVMKANNVDSLEEMLAMAKENGVKLVACNMSMDLMGIKEEELIDGVDLGGVATFLGEVENSSGSLFI